MTTLSRLISEIRERVEKKLWVKLTSFPDSHQKAKLETLLQVPCQRGSNLDRYRKGPVKISGPAFNAAILRYQELHEFGISELDFSHIPPGKIYQRCISLQD